MLWRKLILSLMVCTAATAQAQTVRNLSFNQFKQLIEQGKGHTQVINFWATWCRPCVQELPILSRAAKEYAAQNVDFIFVSVDFQSQQQQVRDKVKELQLNGTVIQLNEKGSDWIDELDKNWQGAIPYTILILPDGSHVNHYDVFDDDLALKKFIDPNLPH